MKKYFLEIYTRPLCSDCQDLKKYLKDNQISFQLHNVQDNPKIEEELKQLTGSRIVPAIVFKKKGLFGQSKVFVGFDANRTEIETLLKKV